MLCVYPVASLFLEYWPSYWEKSGLERRASSQAFCQRLMTLQQLRLILYHLPLSSSAHLVVEKGLGKGAHSLNVSKQEVK